MGGAHSAHDSLFLWLECRNLTLNRSLFHDVDWYHVEGVRWDRLVFDVPLSNVPHRSTTSSKARVEENETQVPHPPRNCVEVPAIKKFNTGYFFKSIYPLCILQKALALLLPS